MVRATRGALAALLLTALAGCGSRTAEEPRLADAAPPPPAVVTRLRVADRTPPDRRPAGVPEAELTAMVREALGEAGVLVAPEPLPGAWRLAIELQVVYGVTDGGGIAPQPVDGHTKALWEAELRMRPPESDEGFYAYLQGVDEAPFAGDAPALAAAVRERLKAGLRPVAQGVRARASVLTQDVPALVALLAHAEPEVRTASAGRLAMLRAPEAVPALAARIREERDRDVVLRMVGALAEIGDDRAVDALIHLVDPKDRELLRGVLDALSTMGGRRVGDFLDVLGTHDSPDVRQMVDDARRRLGGRPQNVEAAAPASAVEGGRP